MKNPMFYIMAKHLLILCEEDGGRSPSFCKILGTATLINVSRTKSLYSLQIRLSIYGNTIELTQSKIALNVITSKIYV